MFKLVTLAQLCLLFFSDISPYAQLQIYMVVMRVFTFFFLPHLFCYCAIFAVGRAIVAAATISLLLCLYSLHETNKHLG